MILWFLVAGAFAGTCAGLFGIGGGMIIVPALVWIFSYYGLHSASVAHLAVGTSLATIVLTSISSLNAHHRLGNVRWQVWRRMAWGLVLGSLLGAILAKFIAGVTLQALIGVAALLVAFKMLFVKTSTSPRALPGTPTHLAAGTGIGAASAIFGIGGGSLTVPYLSHFGLSMREAVGTSAACGLPIALAGAFGFALTGSQLTHLPQYSLGFIYLPAFISVSITSVVMAKFGARLAHRLPSATLKKAFALLLLFVGGQLIYSAVMAGLL